MDLSSYKTKQRAPVSGSYKGHKIFSMGPPSSGGVHIVQILNILENFELKDRLSVESINVTSQAMNLAFQDRAKYLGDSDFVKVPTKGLLSKKYAHELSKQIKETILFLKITPQIQVILLTMKVLRRHTFQLWINKAVLS